MTNDALIDRLQKEILLNTDGEYIVLSKAIDIVREHKRLANEQPDGYTDSDIALAERYLSELCVSGGKSWRLTIPAREDDVDLVLQRVIDRAKSPKRKAVSQAETDLHNLKKVFEALLCVPDDVTMGEVRRTMKDSLSKE